MNSKKTSWKELRKILLAWINKSDVNYRLADSHHGAGWTVDVEDLLSQIIPFISQTIKEERETILLKLLEKGHGGGNWRRLIMEMLKKC